MTGPDQRRRGPGRASGAWINALNFSRVSRRRAYLGFPSARVPCPSLPVSMPVSMPASI